MEEFVRGLVGGTLYIGGTILENVADHIGTAAEITVNVHTCGLHPHLAKGAKHGTSGALKAVGHFTAEGGREIMRG